MNEEDEEFRWGTVHFPGEVTTGVMPTWRDYRAGYKGLESKDFVRIHEMDLKKLVDEKKPASGAVLLECTKGYGKLVEGETYELLEIDVDGYFRVAGPAGPIVGGWEAERFRLKPA